MSSHAAVTYESCKPNRVPVNASESQRLVSHASLRGYLRSHLEVRHTQWMTKRRAVGTPPFGSRHRWVRPPVNTSSKLSVKLTADQKILDDQRLTISMKS